MVSPISAISGLASAFAITSVSTNTISAQRSQKDICQIHCYLGKSRSMSYRGICRSHRGNDVHWQSRIIRHILGCIQDLVAADSHNYSRFLGLCPFHQTVNMGPRAFSPENLIPDDIIRTGKALFQHRPDPPGPGLIDQDEQGLAHSLQILIQLLQHIHALNVLGRAFQNHAHNLFLSMQTEELRSSVCANHHSIKLGNQRQIRGM